jgi:large subunit ribosomal protein L31
VKENTHPAYRPVVFYDAGAQFHLLTRSTIKSTETIEYQGQTYPLVKVDISSATHPFFTGKQTFMDTAGRLEKFSKKFGGTYSFQKTAPAAKK